jgi:hypothetical protein
MFDPIDIKYANVLVELTQSSYDSWWWRRRVHFWKDLEEIRYFGWGHFPRGGNVTIVVTDVRRPRNVGRCISSACLSGSIEIIFDFRVMLENF